MSLAQLLDEADARQLPALIEAWERTDDARRWIARALRIDLALAIERPDLVLPALHRRCVRFGEDAQWFTRTAPPPHARETAALVADWIAEWSPGRTWLRAMWPPPVALDAGVIAEYRYNLRGSIAVTADQIGVVSDRECIVWERATGRMLVGATLVVDRPATTWELTKGVEGRIVLASGGHTIELPIGDEEEANRHEELSPEIALVSGLDSDGYIWWLIDLEHARLIHTGYGVPSASAGRGGKIFVAIRNVIHMFDRSGELGSWSCPNVDDLAVAPEGSLAASTGPLIRVWNPSEALAANVQRRHDPMPATTLWSPDSSQLVSAGRLFDATTGDVIAELDVADWSGAIEGGPAEDYQGFTERGFVEASHRGLRVWDARGVRVVDDRARSVWGSKGVAIDPTGRRYATATEAHLRVTTLFGGEAVFARDLELAGEWRDRHFAFTPTGVVWWELANGERWLLEPDSTTPVITTDDRPAIEIAELNTREGLLVVGDAALPLDEPVIQAPGRPWYASRATLIQLIS